MFASCDLKPTYRLSMLLVDLGGIEPPSGIHFSLLHTTITNIIFIYLIKKNGIVCFTVRYKIFDILVSLLNEHLWIFRINRNHNYNL